MANLSPQLLKGFRDFGPAQAAGRLAMFEKIRQAFVRFGFAPMETPALEYAATLLGKYGAEEKLLYRFTDNGGRDVALRYDHTVPLARFYQANKNNLPKPFKRCVIGPVWRAENPQKGRYREFYQCDVDIVGSNAAVADAECIAALSAALADLGVNDITIKINNRQIIDGVLEVLEVPADKFIPVLRELDRLEKVGRSKVQEGLVAAGLSGDQIKKLLAYIEKPATTTKQLQDIFASIRSESKKLNEGVGDLTFVLDALEDLQVKNTRVDLTLARGLDYYTGTVCEIVLSDKPEFGSIAGGGRYDNLIGSFAGGKEQVPAVGMSIGIDRLIAALEELGLTKIQSKPGVVIFQISVDPRLYPIIMQVATTLRQAGIDADLYYKNEPLDKQFKYAEKKNMNLGILIGEDEIKSGRVTIRDLVSRKQWKVKAEAVAQEVRKALKQ